MIERDSTCANLRLCAFVCVRVFCSRVFCVCARIYAHFNMRAARRTEEEQKEEDYVGLPRCQYQRGGSSFVMNVLKKLSESDPHSL